MRGDREHHAIAGTEPIVGVTVIRVEPKAIGIGVQVEHVEIAVGIRIVQNAFLYTILRVLSGLNQIRHVVMP